ncbi:WD40 repeat-like protein [Ramicandelaber brevisporus]|nr:WD40 repeat-like protein [Ramicandelaber brevisporus]
MVWRGGGQVLQQRYSGCRQLPFASPLFLSWTETFLNWTETLNLEYKNNDLRIVVYPPLDVSSNHPSSALNSLHAHQTNESDPAGSYVGPWTKPVSQPQPQPQPQPEPELDTTASEPTPSNNVPSEDQSAPNERQADKPSQRIPFGSERSTFHGQSEYDYQGRTYMTPPSDAKIVSNPGSQKCHAPSQLIHTYAGHGGKPVSAIQLLPGSGHLLLSAGMDGTVKLWDINRKRGLLRTFIGHSRNVRAIAFNQTGDKFLSASDDTTVKLWDTETGKCVNEFAGRRGAVPNCLAFSPVESRSFLVGYSDRRILQFSTESNEIEQEYSQHLSAINTITFTPNGKHFISTSNDKTIRYWEYGIPVVLRCIADPTMQVMSSAALHPSGNYIAFQSFDNSIVTCNIGGDSLIRVNRAKVFTGHVVAGYSCKPSFSPDGELLASGDGSGVLRVWSWSQKKIVKTINNAHNKVLIGTTWHPHEDSAMITCSWDGKIKLWA